MKAALRAVAGASLLGVVSGPASGAAPSRNVVVIVADCYRSMSDVAVRIDGRRPALRMPNQRYDSVGLCFEKSLPVRHRVQVDVTANQRSKRIVLDLAAKTRSILISAGSLTARTERRPVGLD